MKKDKARGKAGKGENVLEGHKRVGNRLKPDLLTSMNWQFVSYIDEVIPEIILLGLLNDAFGYARGAELSLKLTKALNMVRERTPPLLSGIGDLSPDEVSGLTKIIAKDDLDDLRTAFTPIIVVCSDHPLVALGPTEMEEAVALDHLKVCVGSLYNRHSTQACAAMANLYYVQASTGRLHINKGVRVPDLEAIVARPDSDAANHASAAVRMYAQSLMGHMREERRSPWPDIFWNGCYQLSECDLVEGENE